MERFKSPQAAQLSAAVGEAQTITTTAPPGGSHLLPTTTADGTAVELALDLDSSRATSIALGAGSAAVGLFRTEHLFLDRTDLPSEDEQLRAALEVVTALGGRTVTFRTLDLGPEHLPRAVRRPPGLNPALGIRSIRLSLARPEIFRTQLRALYRAAAVGPVRIVFPFVSGVTELAEVRSFCHQVCDELRRQGVAHNPATPLGCMIETPGAVLTVDHLARHCAFFSVGTNDLIQHCFAAARENEDVAYLYQPLHPAVLRCLKLVADSARSASRPLSICGDMAGDPAFAWILLGLGFREFVITPRRLPIMKSVIRSSHLHEAERLTGVALELGSEIEIEQLVLGAMGERFGPEIDGSPVEFLFGDKDSNLDSQIQSLASCH